MIDHAGLRLAAKPVPVVLLAVWTLTNRPASRYRHYVVAGLVLGSIGDLFLEFPGKGMLPGLAVFLLGHVCYIVAFNSDRVPRALATGLIIYAIGSVAVWLLLVFGNLDSLSVPVVLYVGVISTMLWRAWARLGDSETSQFSVWSGVVGASSFFLSDTLLAVHLFLVPLPISRFLVMTTYWAGQTGIALSVPGARKKLQGPNPMQESDSDA
jgi:uncharacterized membrane protein YhhN